MLYGKFPGVICSSPAWSCIARIHARCRRDRSIDGGMKRERGLFHSKQSSFDSFTLNARCSACGQPLSPFSLHTFTGFCECLPQNSAHGQWNRKVRNESKFVHLSNSFDPIQRWKSVASIRSMAQSYFPHPIDRSNQATPVSYSRPHYAGIY